VKVYYKISDFKALGNAVVTSGTFDGVHLGHQKIINRLIEIADSNQCETVVITFWPHPRLVISPNTEDFKLLNTIDEKIVLLERMGVDHLLILPFTREFSELTSEQYIEDILINGIGTKILVIGYDHRFGRNREGGIDYLVKHSHRFKIQIEEIPRQEIENITISSTKVRNAVQNGEVEAARDLLGRNYSFSGVVVKGRQLGRTIGFPTANVQLAKNYKLLPRNGVYGVKTQLRGQSHYGIMNIGNRPTVDGTGRTQEVHIFDFNDDIYGENLDVELLFFVRDEQKFDSLNELIKQIETDCNLVRQQLKADNE
jgi:riboflavin kinase / FMN adenylyltransferase